MRDRLREGATWLERMRTQHAAGLVYYTRSAAALEVAATHGRSTFEVSDGSGMPVNFESDDWIVQVADLELDGVPTVPAPGDRVIEGELSNGAVYEVMCPPGQPCYRFADQFRTTFRIHTKYIGVQPPIAA